MSLIDLSRRVTQRFEDYERYSKSSDSLILVDGPVLLDDGPASLELTIGDGWFHCSDNRLYAIPNDGLQLKPKDSIVVETVQVIGVPLNICGLVTGKGKFIFQGIFISSGKIDPGFCAKLRVGLYNGGDEIVILKKGDPFCYCCFFAMETNLDVSRRKGDLSPKKFLPELPKGTKVKNFLKANWAWLLTTLIAIISLIISILRV